MLKWRIYYDDGSTFSNADGGPECSPVFGVICIVQPDAVVNRTILSRWDFYYWDGDGWSGCDIYGVIDRASNDLPMRSLRQGRTISSADYTRILDMADKDPDFPLKGGQRAGEKPGIYG